MIPYVSLGFYKPKRWNAALVGREILAITRRAGLKPHFDLEHGPLENVAWRSEVFHAEVRRRTFKTKMGEGWHYDGDTTPGSKPDCRIVLWASNHPTQIKLATEPEIYTPQPYEIIVFSNLVCRHRRPPGVPKIRWVFRQRVAV